MVFDNVEISCPYCGEINILNIEASDSVSDILISDCEICCRAFEVITRIDPDGNLNFDVRSEEGF